MKSTLSNVLIYSTEYHLNQENLIKGTVSAKIRIGYKNQLFYFRIIELMSCLLQLATRYKKCNIFIPRSGTKDNWLVYYIYKKRCTLISDGLSDFLDNIPVACIGMMSLKFYNPVQSQFHLKNRSLTKRLISFKEDGPVAIFNKRGRDTDYVSEYVNRALTVSIVLNPLIGSFSHIYAAPSTVIFELPKIMKSHLSIISQSHCNVLDIKRRKILISYEKSLSSLGYKII
jgi:hypothetical protein